jgi:tetratricopeptide (TPR) repeat protein
MPTQYSLVLWAAAFAIWFGATWRQRQGAARASNPTDSADRDDSLFIQAQTEYLQGNWEEAEWLLRQRLSREPRDVEARLLLATLYRRRGRRELARDQLNHLARFDESLAWREEIERESERLVPEPAVDANGPSTESAEENANSSSNSTLPVQPRMIIAKPAQRAA